MLHVQGVRPHWLFVRGRQPFGHWYRQGGRKRKGVRGWRLEGSENGDEPVCATGRCGSSAELLLQVCDLLLSCGEFLLLGAQLCLERIVVGLLHLIAARQRQCEDAAGQQRQTAPDKGCREMHETS